MTIAEVSKKYNLTQDTIRYYERIGLLPEIPRTKLGIREQGKKTIVARKQLLIEQREVLLKKQEEIKNTIERLDYKVELYNEIEAGKRKDFMEQP